MSSFFLGLFLVFFALQVCKKCKEMYNICHIHKARTKNRDMNGGSMVAHYAVVQVSSPASSQPTEHYQFLHGLMHQKRHKKLKLHSAGIGINGVGGVLRWIFDSPT
jgi:hypothetical protein